ncbi:MAG: lysophospholipid acyltransferase family protein [Candidatus Brocadia sp.]|nr:MAG: lysophospholipid acyltransferase family protein [Candidatus Brocadia sp.]
MKFAIAYKMKKFKFFIAGILGAWLIRSLALTIRIHEEPQGFTKKIITTHAIYTFWHCLMLIPAYVARNKNIQVLISQHSDGEYIAQVIKRLGFGVIRGSTTRGGRRAVKVMIDKMREGSSVAITPDGPRGPRFVMQPGSIYLSQKTGLPIVPAAIGLASYWKLPSWDEFRIPKPFSRALIMCGDPIYIPSNLTGQEMEYYRLLVERIMNEMTEKADIVVRGKKRRLC